MSQENVEIVKAHMDAYNRRDWDAVFSLLAPCFEMDLSRSVAPWRGVYRLDQLRQLFEEWVGTFGSFRNEPHEFIEAGDHVLVPLTTHVRGRDGIEAAARATWAWTIRHGTVERISMYQEKEEALEALGRSEQDAHADS